MSSVYNQYVHGTVLYNVPARFDGKNIYSESSNVGQSINVAALDSNHDGKFSVHDDAVLFLNKGVLTRDSFESIATKDGLAKLSSMGDRVITLEDMKKAGLSMGVDRNRDGEIGIKTSSVCRGLSKLWNGINEGPVSYNGKEIATPYEKECAAADVFKKFDTTLDTNANTCEEAYTFDQEAYDAFSRHIDKSRAILGIGGAGGIGAFLLASSSLTSGLVPGSLPYLAAGIGGVMGLVVGGMFLVSALCIAKTRPDLPVRL